MACLRLESDPWSRPPISCDVLGRVKGGGPLLGEVRQMRSWSTQRRGTCCHHDGADVRMLYSTGRYLDPGAVASGKLE